MRSNAKFNYLLFDCTVDTWQWIKLTRLTVNVQWLNGILLLRTRRQLIVMWCETMRAATTRLQQGIRKFDQFDKLAPVGIYLSKCNINAWSWSSLQAEEGGKLGDADCHSTTTVQGAGEDIKGISSSSAVFSCMYRWRKYLFSSWWCPWLRTCLMFLSPSLISLKSSAGKRKASDTDGNVYGY